MVATRHVCHVCVVYVVERVRVLINIFYVGGLGSVLQPTGRKQTSTLAYLSWSQWDAGFTLISAHSDALAFYFTVKRTSVVIKDIINY